MLIFSNHPTKIKLSIPVLFLFFSSIAFGKGCLQNDPLLTQKSKKNQHGQSTNAETKKDDDTDDAESKEESPPEIGNFALPLSQQLAPLLSLGQNTIGKNNLQLSVFADNFSGTNQHFTDLIPNILYGITDEASVFVIAPYAASYKSEDLHSSGFEDSTLQFEYAFYSKSTKQYVQTATVLGGMTFPTGSVHADIPTGIGSPSFILGGTFNRTYTDWYGFISGGEIITTSHDNTKFGDTSQYQAGLGRNIFTIDSKLIVACLVEADGIYNQKNRIDGEIDPNSGGNTIYVTPSLWVSTKKLIFQLGIGYPVVQHLNGEQIKTNYLLAGSITWTVM